MKLTNQKNQPTFFNLNMNKPYQTAQYHSLTWTTNLWPTKLSILTIWTPIFPFTSLRWCVRIWHNCSIFYEYISSPVPPPPQPTHNLNHPPHIHAQMEEFRIVIYDRIQDLVIERLITSDFIAHAAKWDTLRTLVDIDLQNVKTFTSEYVASSSQKQEQL